MATKDAPQQTEQQLADAAHEQKLNDGKPLESMEDAQNTFEELAREAMGETAAPAPAPAPAAAKEPTKAPAAPSPSPSPAPAPAGSPAPSAAPAGPILTDPDETVSISRKDLDELRNGLKATSGRVASLQRQMATGAATQAKAGGGDAPTKEAIAAAQGDTKKWTKMKEDFPEWADAMEERISSLGAGEKVDLTKLRDELKTELVSDAQARRDAAIEEEHPGWTTKMQSPGFRDWFNKQDDAYRNRMWNSHSELSIIRMLDKFEQAQQQSSSSAPAPAPAAATRTTTAPAVDLSAAVTKRGSAGIPAASNSGEGLEGKAYWDWLATQEAATK